MGDDRCRAGQVGGQRQGRVARDRNPNLLLRARVRVQCVHQRPCRRLGAGFRVQVHRNRFAGDLDERRAVAVVVVALGERHGDSFFAQAELRGLELDHHRAARVEVGLGVGIVKLAIGSLPGNPDALRQVALAAVDTRTASEHELQLARGDVQCCIGSLGQQQVPFVGPRRDQLGTLLGNLPRRRSRLRGVRLSAGIAIDVDLPRIARPSRCEPAQVPDGQRPLPGPRLVPVPRRRKHPIVVVAGIPDEPLLGQHRRGSRRRGQYDFQIGRLTVRCIENNLDPFEINVFRNGERR